MRIQVPVPKLWKGKMPPAELKAKSVGKLLLLFGTLGLVLYIASLLHWVGDRVLSALAFALIAAMLITGARVVFPKGQAPLQEKYQEDNEK